MTEVFTGPFDDLRKIAAPAKRWEWKRDIREGKPPLTHGTFLEMRIEETNCEERIAYAQRLSRTIDWLREGRPLFVLESGREVRYKVKSDFH